MKKIIIMLTAALICTSAFAQNLAAERAARRQARQTEYENGIDALIASGNYRFKPDSYRLEQTGPLQYIRNGASELTIMNNYCEVLLPYYQGEVPPYRLFMLNTATKEMEGYSTKKTADGWHITFEAPLYAGDDYEFDLTVVSKTGHAELTLSVPFGVTVTYSGAIMNPE